MPTSLFHPSESTNNFLVSLKENPLFVSQNTRFHWFLKYSGHHWEPYPNNIKLQIESIIWREIGTHLLVDFCKNVLIHCKSLLSHAALIRTLSIVCCTACSVPLVSCEAKKSSSSSAIFSVAKCWKAVVINCGKITKVPWNLETQAVSKESLLWIQCWVLLIEEIG